jgi:regulator of protease activity HflC (stomatin/prohibitin superfamily)
LIGTVTLTIAIVIALILISGVRVAQEYQRGVVFPLGRYVGTRGPGL